MKIVVIGGTGLIGKKVVARLSAQGHEVIAAAPQTGVNALTGEGLAQALAGAKVVVDLANSPSFEDAAVLHFFETSGRNLAVAEKEAGVAHHVALSVVGTDKLEQSGYFRAKIAQEALIRQSGVPFTIVRSTQFMEFLGGIVQSAAQGDAIRLSSALIQPISSDDVAQAVAERALAAPANGIVEIAGPEQFKMSDLVQRYLKAIGDARTVQVDPAARYFGAELQTGTLVPEGQAHLGRVSFEDWMRKSQAH